METFRPHRALVLLACSSLAWSGADAQTQGSSAAGRSTTKRVEALQRQVTEQGRQLDELRKQSAEQEARYRELQDRLTTQEARGAPRTDGAKTAEAKPAAEGEAVEIGPRPVRVGVAPSDDAPPAPVAQLFDEPSILTPKGTFVF